MRLPTFILIFLGLGAIAGTGWFVWRATAETREWRAMLTLSERRVQPLAAAEEQRFQSLVRKRLPQESPGRKACWVASLEVPDQPRRLIIVMETNRIQQAGDVLFQIHLFDDGYKLIGSTLASSGSGQRQLRCRKGVGSYGFQVESTLQIPGGILERVVQHYVLINDVPVLIRAETPEGRLVRMEYEDRSRMLGPGLPDRTPEGWEQSLSSPDVAEVLRTLMWLGGRHGPRRLTVDVRDDAQHFDDTRRRPAVAERISELTQSPHPWVAEAAKAVVLWEILGK
jgi:hypothetical protein